MDMIAKYDAYNPPALRRLRGVTVAVVSPQVVGSRAVIWLGARTGAGVPRTSPGGAG